MPILIDGERIVADDWTFIEDATDVSDANRIIVPAAFAAAQAPSIFGDDREIGVWLPGDAEPDEIVGLLNRIKLIAIRFPSFNDGRGLSLAVLLRSRYGFVGELRAIGEVHEDLLHYMRRCGFDSFQLPDGRDPAVALAALHSLSDFYQGSVIDPRPAFRRVARGSKPTQAV
jgi:uncharacterized protein (DUF934 family)